MTIFGWAFFIAIELCLVILADRHSAWWLLPAGLLILAMFAPKKRGDRSGNFKSGRFL